MAAEDPNWEDFPSYYDLYLGIKNFVLKTYRENFVDQVESASVESTWKYYNFSSNDILFVIFLSLIWTVLRHLATERVFKPLASHYALTPTNAKKMPESAWKFVYYLSAWSYTLYVVVLCGEYHFFQRPSTVWKGWNLEDHPGTKIYLMYMAQCSFYLHSLYATLFLDVWRKDSFVMMVHHVLTLLLIAISYSLRFHNIGTIVLLTHDGCDILLEFTKLNVYFKEQGNKLVQLHEYFANASFLLFTVAWYISRLYLYPLRVLYTSTTIVEEMHLRLPCALLMNSLLWILQLLNLYWFMFIVQFLFRVATGQVQEVDDTREYDVEEKFRQFSTQKNSSENILQNGNVKTNGSCDEAAVTNSEKDNALQSRIKKQS